MATPIHHGFEGYSYGDYLSRTDGERWEVIEGVPYAVTPSPSRTHQEVSKHLLFQFESFLQNHTCKVYHAPFDVRLPDGGEAEDDIRTVVQPDLLVVCDPARLDERGCLGSPDLVIEIVSPSTASVDYITKLALYEKHRIPEYWIVHPTDRIVTIFRLDDRGTYGKPAIYARPEKIPVMLLPGLSIDLGQVFS